MNKPESLHACPWSDPGPEGQGLVVHDFLTTRLSALMGSLRRQVTIPYAKSVGLLIGEWRVLSLVAHAGVLPFGELVIQSASDKALVSRRVKSLEKRGLLTTQPETESARRKIACAITPAGKALYEQAIVIARRRQAEVLRTLTRKERESLFAIIGKLQAALDG